MRLAYGPNANDRQPMLLNEPALTVEPNAEEWIRSRLAEFTLRAVQSNKTVFQFKRNSPAFA